MLLSLSQSVDASCYHDVDTQVKIKHNTSQYNVIGTVPRAKEELLQQPGIEPGTSAVLKPRHNQLDHRCFV